ncbi:MAG: hypothetical protein JST00_44350 [Deltaproteobacteria bacterium]|nr:hypothetical protein [Deltaproteobacteria bacterium]
MPSRARALRLSAGALVRPAFGGSALAAIVVLLAGIASCSDLKTAEGDDPPGSDGGDGDSGADAAAEPPGTDGSVGADASVDAGPPPADFECKGDEWTKTTKTKAECAPRQVRVLTASAPIDVNAISIARTPAGRVGIVYNSEEGSETGEMHLLHFLPSTPSFAAPVLVKRATGFAFHDGYLSKLAASAPDTLAVLTYDMDDISSSGEVHLRKLVGGKEPLTDDLAFNGVMARPTEIAIASDAAGNIVATARRKATVGATATLLTAGKTPTGPFTSLPSLATNLLPAEAPGAGAVSMVFDPVGQLHLLYHHNEVPQHSNPRYHVIAGGAWSFRKTIDNNVVDGLSGWSPRLAVFGTKKYAAYFFRKAQQVTPAVADLRLASWDSDTDTPSIEILDQGIPSPDVQYPAYRVAMAVDKFGLVHVALLRPSSANVGYLEYRRQTRVTGGGTKWLSDIVDGDVISQTSEAYVDMVVDGNARPHIAYRSAKDGKVRYATRFDR